MRLNFGKGEYGVSHFYCCSVTKWILKFHNDLLFATAAKWFIIITVFATITFVIAFALQMWCICIPSEPWTKQAVPIRNKVSEGSKLKNCHKNSNYNWLFAYLMEVKITMELWECEIWVWQFCVRELAKSRGWGVSDFPPLPDFCLFVMNLKKEHF